MYLINGEFKLNSLSDFLKLFKIQMVKKKQRIVLNDISIDFYFKCQWQAFIAIKSTSIECDLFEEGSSLRLEGSLETERDHFIFKELINHFRTMNFSFTIEVSNQNIIGQDWVYTD